MQNKKIELFVSTATLQATYDIDEPKRNRIFKIENRKTYYLPHRYDVNWREMDPNMAPTLIYETEYDTPSAAGQKSHFFITKKS